MNALQRAPGSQLLRGQRQPVVQSRILPKRAVPVQCGALDGPAAARSRAARPAAGIAAPGSSACSSRPLGSSSGVLGSSFTRGGSGDGGSSCARRRGVACPAADAAMPLPGGADSPAGGFVPLRDPSHAHMGPPRWGPRRGAGAAAPAAVHAASPPWALRDARPAHAPPLPARPAAAAPGGLAKALANVRALAFAAWTFTLAIPLFLVMLLLSPFVAVTDKFRCAPGPGAKRDAGPPHPTAPNS
jgi:hypothetical protein